MTTKRILALIISFVMMFTFIPSGTFAYADDSEDYIEIWTVEDLYNVRNDLSANYKLMADIDLTEVLAEGGKYNYSGKGWEPLGLTTQTEYTGTFDGNGYTVSGLSIIGYINNESNDNNSNGLFWINSGVIKNLSVFGTVTYAEGVGEYGYNNSLIVGMNKGTISHCYANGSITWGKQLGLISAKNTGTIEYCKSEGSIVAKGKSGGICGYASSGTIEACYNSADVGIGENSYTTGAYIGGILGYSDSNTVHVSNCYNVGVISGCEVTQYYQSTGYQNSFSFNAGITYGDATVENCYNAGLIRFYWVSKNGTYDKTEGITDGGMYSVCNKVGTNCYCLDTYDNNASSHTATCLNETQMKMQGSFVGFDFDNVWTLETATDYKYPQLRNNMQDPNKHVDIIEWKTQPTKIDYYTDEEIDPAGGVFTAYYIDDTHEDIEVTKDMLSGYDMTQTGVQTVTVTFREGTLTYDILTSTRPEVKSMTLETMPDKTEFARGTKFDFTGATAKIEYVNGKTEIIPITAEETTGGNIEQSGTYTITFEKYGKSITFEVKVVPVKPIGIKLVSLPDKTTYLEGQSVDFTGMVVKLEYNSGKTETITDYTIGEYENTVGTKTITVTYENFTTSFEVEFLEKTLTGIMVTTQPARAKYVAGEEFDPTGMVVKAVYDNGFSEEVTDYTVSTLGDTIGWQTLLVEYNGKTATIKVMVEEKELISIAVSQLPDKTEYIEGETFDPTGMVVLANYNDVYTTPVTDYTISANTNKVGENTVTILYEGKTATFKINVVEKKLLKIEVTPPTKTDYISGEEFDATGMVVKAVYDNGKSEAVTDYTVTGFGDAEETNIVTIEYQGKTSAFAVTIHTPDEWTVTVAPTCTEAGSRELHCVSCGKLIRTEELAALGHDWSAWTDVKTPTCVDKGSQKRICSVCKLEEFRDVDPSGHTWSTGYTVDKAATCTEEGSESIHCTVCGVVDPATVRTTAKLPHVLGEWTVTKAATCELSGVQQRKCANCDYLETEEITALGHNYEVVENSAVEPTCEGEGKKDDSKCTRCGNVIAGETIPALGHEWGEWTVTKEATAFEEGTETRVCLRDTSHKEERAIPKIKYKGWKKLDGYWYFFDENGVMATSTWKKDSNGWCYLGSDGRMVTNDWAPDNAGMCWIGSAGYMVEKTQWIKVDGNWYYINKGYMVTKKWMKDSKGWCYVGADGVMVANGWAPDSKGLCWMDSTGHMLEKTQWVKYNGEWYHITKGYMDKSKWMKDSKGWCYVGADGVMVANGWAKDSKGLCWMDSTGHMLEKTQWVKYEGGWYYIEKGYMAKNKWAKDSIGWCYLSDTGLMVTNDFVKDSKGYCWIGPDGYMEEVDKWIGEPGVAGSSYIIKGYRVDNQTILIDGKYYTFDKDGKLIP